MYSMTDDDGAMRDDRHRLCSNPILTLFRFYLMCSRFGTWHRRGNEMSGIGVGVDGGSGSCSFEFTSGGRSELEEEMM
jgi:hypothetical protein